MAVFDMLSETFHLMAGPPTATADQTKVFDMEGRLVVADFGDEDHVDRWFLKDYNAGKWERRHQAPTPGTPVPWESQSWRGAARSPWPRRVTTRKASSCWATTWGYWCTT
jgi:hypothetical protein